MPSATEVVLPLNPTSNSNSAGKSHRKRVSNVFTRRLHILNWLPAYDREKASSDLIAGITLGLTIIPQSIAYAALAGVPAENGLYSAFLGSIIYVFVGTIPQVSIGPTSLMSLLIYQYCYGKPVQFAVVLAFMAGLVELLMGLLELGFIVNFIPSSVTKAFTSGTSIIVATVQLKNLLGIRKKGFLWPKELWASIYWRDAVVGLICLIILLCLKKLATVSFSRDDPGTRRLKRILWYISISRNALVVFTSGLLVYVWWHFLRSQDNEIPPINLSAKVTSSWPSISWPPFVFTVEDHFYSLTEVLLSLGSAVIVLPIVAVLGNVAIAKAFAKDGHLDASQEMFSLGLCNIAGSFFSAVPTSGAFTRSAVSEASGVRTPMAGLYTGIIVLLALSILTPYFQYIPRSTLSAVLIMAVIFLVDFTPMRELWNSSKKDFCTWAGCLLVCLCAGVEMGLLFGTVLKMIFLVLGLANPKLEVIRDNCDGVEFILVRPMTDVFYSGIEEVRTAAVEAGHKYGGDLPVVIDCSGFRLFDATFVDTLIAVAKNLMKTHGNLLVLLSMPGNLKQRQQLLAGSDNLRIANGNLLTSKDLV